MAEAKNAGLAERIESGGGQSVSRSDKEFWPVVLKKQMEGFQAALAGTGIQPEHFYRVALTAIRESKQLQQADMLSILGAVMTAAQLGLEPHGPLGQAYLVPYKGKAKLIVGYQGFIELAYRSGRVDSIIAHVVREHDEFQYRLGTNAHIDHLPAKGDRGPIVGAYAIAEIAGGGQVFEYMEISEIHARRERSAAKDSGPWVTDYEAMVRKTAIRQLFKWLPASVSVSAALSVDDRGTFKAIPTTIEDLPEVIDVEEVDEVDEV